MDLTTAHVGPYAAVLSLAERIHLMNMLPEQGNVISIRRVDELKKKLLPSEAEIERWNLKIEGASFQWDPKSDTDAVIEVGQSMWDLVVKTLKDMDSAGTMTTNQVSLYEKFVENEKPPLGLAE